jgi:hypothetical protein
MKPKKIQKKMTLKKQTIAALNVDEMRKQHGGIETAPVVCTVDTACITECRPISACDYTCYLSC